MRSYGISAQMLDHPNARSSHSRPTPRGGGLGIVVATTLGLLLLWLLGYADSRTTLALSGGGVAVAMVGFMDDRGSVRVPVRLLVHCAAAAWVVWTLGGLPPLRIGSAVFTPGVPGGLLAVIGAIWVLNLFNFMDGIDGLAGSEAVFVTFAGSLCVGWDTSSQSALLAALLLGAASLVFLLCNWPPARIFMGDVGSGYLGLMIAAIALATARTNTIVLYQWLIVGGVFFVDATVTLLRRLLRGEKVYSAHRTHAYQWLSRRWGSHRRVTVCVWFVNVLWLLPWALLIPAAPDEAWLITLAALIPLVITTLLAGAGRAER